MSVDLGNFAEQVLNERNALYRLIQRASGQLDALDPFGDGEPVPFTAVNEVRQWLTSETDAVLPPDRAITEGAAE